MLSKLLTSLFGSGTQREFRKLLPIAEEIRAYEPRMVAMTNDELGGRTADFKQRLAQGDSLDDLLPEAFAVVREAAKRVTGMRPFDVQCIGGYVLHQGAIIEMVTGEGKTLAATMPAYLNALTGRGVHIVTVNDYLARRDAEWMGPIYQFLGLTVGVIQAQMSPPERQVAYRADITYGTNNEFGFDYLRDNSAVSPDRVVQRELNYAIIDEVDSILIDEARTPLIISGRPEKSSDTYVHVDEVVRKLRRDKHFTIDEKHNQVVLTDEGQETAEKLLNVENLFTEEHIGLVHMIEQSIRAHYLFNRDDEYMVRNGEVLIVDEFTGRVMEGRRYSDGLHQAIEAKEQVPIRFESQTIASITYQNLFKLYNKISGMTGTAVTEAPEFQKVYGLDVTKLDTNLPLIREDLPDLVFYTEEGKFHYLLGDIQQIHAQGRPILVGTISIEKSEYLAERLRAAGIEDVQVLNAKHHEREASIIANAGKKGAITLATNMAGRGTDIKLAEGVRELGGLYIIGTERHESRRIDNQLRGRCGRQGDPGTTGFYVSLQDEVARLFGGPRVKKVLGMMGGDQIDTEPLSNRFLSRSVERAQTAVEQNNAEMRKHLLDYDEVMNRQRMYIYGMRRAVLEDKDISDRIGEMFENCVSDALDEYAPQEQLPEEWDIDGLKAELKRLFGFTPDVHAEGEDFAESLVRQVHERYKANEASMAQTIRGHYREHIGSDETRIDFPQLARKRMHDLEKMVVLKTVDDKWIDHLRDMDYLRESVRLRAFGQRDPLLEYKREGFELFQALVRSIEESVAQNLFRLSDPEIWKLRELHQKRGTMTAQTDPLAQLRDYTYVAADKQADRSFAFQDTSRFALAGQSSQAQPDGGATQTRQAARPKVQQRRVTQKVKPNDPCPCGSGKKYKKCCGSVVAD
ncbi:MAG: preprotein translocase subunit SecA [Candidatus Hydrogenedentota bacterium]